MKILVFSDDVEINDDLIDDCQCMVTVDQNRKGFVIDRQVALSNTRLFMKHLGYKRSMSELKHILLAEKKYPIKYYQNKLIRILKDLEE